MNQERKDFPGIISILFCILAKGLIELNYKLLFINLRK